VAKQAGSKFDAAGWLFWLIVFGILVCPSTFVAWYFRRPGKPVFFLLGIGVLSAAVGASFVSWGVNSALQYRRKKQRLQERKKAKKRK
jgi:hypothetical protein